MKITTLRPNVTREDAVRELSPGGIPGLLRRSAFGPLHSIADLYIPFRLFRVEVTNNGRPQSFVFGLDAVAGWLDLYRLDSAPDASELISVSTRNHLPGLLSNTSARELVIDKIRRAIFTRGFFRMRELRISASPLPGLCHIPYWVGFYGQERQLKFLVMDAVRRRFEGGKVRQLLQSWLGGK